jgi:hypothetical protein
MIEFDKMAITVSTRRTRRNNHPEPKNPHFSPTARPSIPCSPHLVSRRSAHRVRHRADPDDSVFLVFRHRDRAPQTQRGIRPAGRRLRALHPRRHSAQGAPQGRHRYHRRLLILPAHPGTRGRRRQKMPITKEQVEQAILVIEKTPQQHGHHRADDRPPGRRWHPGANARRQPEESANIRATLEKVAKLELREVSPR